MLMRIVMFLALLIFLGCASGDMSRHFTLSHHKDSTSYLLQSVADSLPYYGFNARLIARDTLIALSYIKQGSLNEREIQLTFIEKQGKGECMVFVKTTTYFRQDTIIEYYDQNQGFPASYRKDFMPVVLMAERIGKTTLRKKK